VWVVWVIVTAAVDMLLAMGDCFLGKKGVSRMMGVLGVIGLLSSKFGCDGIGVLIYECRMRTKTGSGLSSSDSELCSRGLVSSVCSSSE
jgi:hypothetical protein